ncbi:MAG: class IV adenylate cyclase [Pirellulales bacterium]|nr:class IV adenylate cyclase [Pirellulales bacterium]
MLEVEQKFPLADPPAFVARLGDLGVCLAEPIVQVDQYFAHPARDFAQTDEALRIRRVGSENRVTYKGPKLDAATKTRREIELPLAPGDDAAAGYEALLVALGFRPVRAVRKARRKAELVWEGRTCEIALDEVEGLGTFTELEFQAEPAQLDATRAALTSLASRLGLSQSERRSYLELLLTP